MRRLSPDEAMRSVLLAGGLALLLSGVAIGCSSRPPPSGEGEQRDERFSPVPGKASVYVVRSGAVGREYMLPIMDGRVLGGLLPGTYLRVDVEPGRHRFGSFAGGDRSPPLEVELSAGELFFARMLRVYASAAPKTEIQRVGADSGRRAVLQARAGVALHFTPRPPARADPNRARASTPAPGRGLVYVLRRGMESGMRVETGSNATPKPKLAVILDGRIVALMSKRTAAAFEVDPGLHSLVGAVFPTHALEPLEFEVEAGGSYFFEASAGRGDKRHAPIEALSDADGRQVLQSERVTWLE